MLQAIVPQVKIKLNNTVCRCLIFVAATIFCACKTTGDQVKAAAQTTVPAVPTTGGGTGNAPDFSLVGFASQNGGTTGGQGGTTLTATNYTELKNYLESSTKMIVKVNTRIYNGVKGGSISVNSNKTLLGEGSGAFLDGVGLSINGKSNIIIQNIKITMSSITDTTDPAVYSPTGDEGRPQILVNGGDCISIFGSSSNVWIDHCEAYNIDPKVQTNQDLYDGLVDAKGASAYITISWCYFHDHHKCTLVGSSDSDNFDRKITFHHNYYSNITERAPSYRFGTAHVFNNYYKGVYGSGVNARMGAVIYVEKNYFDGCKDPITTKNSTSNGFWNVNNNVFDNCTGSQPTTSTSTAFTPAYNYTNVVTNYTDVKTVVMQYAGVGKL